MNISWSAAGPEMDGASGPSEHARRRWRYYPQVPGYATGPFSRRYQALCLDRRVSQDDQQKVLTGETASELAIIRLLVAHPGAASDLFPGFLRAYNPSSLAK